MPGSPCAGRTTRRGEPHRSPRPAVWQRGRPPAATPLALEERRHARKPAHAAFVIRSGVVRDFVYEHRALILKHARTHARANGDKVPAEDIAREMELVLEQLNQQKTIELGSVESPDAYLRGIVLHAARRAKRRRTLIDQIAAGDDLQAISDDLGALDSDLPEAPLPLSVEAKAARAALDGIREKLSPRDALIFALLIEDDASLDEVARILATSPSDVSGARERIMHHAETLNVASEPGRKERAL